MREKIIVVNGSSTFEYRVRLFAEVMKLQGYDVWIISTDFDHVSKTKRHSVDSGCELLPTRHYKKNISLQRIYSHLRFSQDAFNYIKEECCTYLYLVIPPNSQSGIARRYKKLHPDTKVVMDVIDLWPESFPSKNTNHFPFTIWGAIRNHNLKYADCIFTECNVYHENLAKFCGHNKLNTIYWCHEEETTEQAEAVESSIQNASLSKDYWILGYLGSINYIIDIEKICTVIETFKKTRPVIVKVIGDGDNSQNFTNAMKNAGATVKNYGKIYDFQKKLEILSSCHFGINIMMPTVRVGMSMKSVDYLEFGLPILNGIPGDTEKIIQKFHCGINLKELNVSNKYDVQMKKAARFFYIQNCSYDAYKSSLMKIFPRSNGHQ